MGMKRELLAESRIYFASKVAKETAMQPEAINNFICCVAETVSIPDLELIYSMFHQTLENIEKKPNLMN